MGQWCPTGIPVRLVSTLAYFLSPSNLPQVALKQGPAEGAAQHFLSCPRLATAMVHQQASELGLSRLSVCGGTKDTGWEKSGAVGPPRRGSRSLSAVLSNRVSFVAHRRTYFWLIGVNRQRDLNLKSTGLGTRAAQAGPDRGHIDVEKLCPPD